MHEADGDNAEQWRLSAADGGTELWRDWGPYLSERAWGTVREDYSADGDAWTYFPFEHARSRAYRWSEDGLAGLSNHNQDWCFALAFWNGRDPILKERAFGLGNGEGNHGEDAKDYWWYEDGTPTASWLRWRYHYPQAEFPYARLRAENAARGKDDTEFELIDTGIFDDDRYFIITADYAKAAPDAYAVRITVENAGPDRATLHVLPHLWFRDMWSWGRAPDIEDDLDTVGLMIRGEPGRLTGTHPHTGTLVLQDVPAPGSAALGADATAPPPLMCDNETNAALLFGGENRNPYTKDGIGDHVVHGTATVNPNNCGTKGALHYILDLAPGERRELDLWLAAADCELPDHAQTLADREREADGFYAAMTPPGTSPDDAKIMRQAYAGLVWSKQFYHYDVHRWISGDPSQPLPPDHRAHDRNAGWGHFWARDVLLMPDPWEYPWFAAWDLAFHCAVYSEIDPGFARAQLMTFLSQRYLHPNGQMPAYEWNFDDVNPPVLAWAVLRVYYAQRDTEFLKACFHKLLANFTFWVNRKDAGQDNIFEGGFLGLDNIGVFDRSNLPVDGVLEQSDGTGWMAFFSLCMLVISIELTLREPVYEEMACKFAEHYAYIAAAINDSGIWDDEDGFYYDRLRRDGCDPIVMRVRSMVGVVPLLASFPVSTKLLERLPRFAAHLEEFTTRRPEYAKGVLGRKHATGGLVFSLANDEQAARVLSRLADPEEFLSPYGLRSLSIHHRDHPFMLGIDGVDASVDYEPGESHSGMFGGNSNWRGPVWMPLNYLFLEAVYRVGPALGVVTHPGEGRIVVDRPIFAENLRQRLIGIFRTDPNGRLPVLGDNPRLQGDPRWRDRPWFYEYFHADSGAGLGAAHQTGWTALIASLIRNPTLGFPPS
ncbi:MAG TPA: glucosidase [Actinocrinis sp.]|uniref:MGH1-like glycoside hydrolase domain-containing protein n=1 Tax=Actinocrinis sp. TaxID=1920516 RepID=UPI002DDCB8B8|nr:glucosidase [Actinocrinis sp.]HEV3170163.1 glucosidase [Actinocrinis sp.]